MGWKKNRAFRPSWNKRDPSSLDQVREQLLHALFKKNLFTLTSCSTEESTVWSLNLVSASVGLTKKSLPWFAWFGVDITIVYAAKYLKNEVTLKSFCWFLAKKYRMMTSWEVFFLFITFRDIWDISIFLTKKFDCQTAKIQRVYFRCSTDFESPWGSCPAKPGLRPEARTGGSDRVSHVWYIYIYSKSAILEMGFRTFRLKCAANILSIWFDRIIYFQLTFFCIWSFENTKTRQPKKSLHPNPNKVTFTQLSLSHFPNKNPWFHPRMAMLHRLPAFIWITGVHWIWVTTTSNGVCVCVCGCTLRWSSVYSVYILYHVYMIQ